MREMKDSGIQWIGRMPEHWNVYPIKSIILQNDGGIWGEDPDDNVNNTIVLRSTEQTVDGKWDIIEPAQRDLTSISNADYYRCIEGDLLITKSSGSDLHIGKTTIVDENVEKMKCCYSNFIQRIRVDRSYEPRLIWYLFNSSIVREQFVYMQNSTSGIGNLNAKYIAELRVPLPGKKEQNCIINYLDEKCAKIDAIIEKQQEIIEKLKEYKLSVITETVTKGLNPNVEMKDSGVEWIGRMPASWNLTTVARIATVVRGASPRPAGDPLFFNGKDVPWITVAEVTKGEGKYVDSTETFLTYEGAKQSRIVEEGTLLLSNSGATLGVPKITRIEGCINDGSVAFNDLTINKEYLLYLLKGRTLELRKQMQGYGQPNLNTTIVKGIEVPLPSETDQQSIVEFLDKKCETIDKTVEDRELAMEKLLAYKKSLIYEVVTGKREV